MQADEDRSAVSDVPDAERDMLLAQWVREDIHPELAVSRRQFGACSVLYRVHT
jgi:hypothetical protein